MKLYEVENNEVINTFIVTTFHDKYILKCLNTLVNTIDRHKHRIILIQSPAENDYPLLYDKVKPYIDVFIKTEKNYGFDKSVNLGIMMSHTPYFTVIHDDTWFVHKGWWDDVRRILDNDQTLLMCQPFQRYRREMKQIPEFPNDEEYKELLKIGQNHTMAELYCMVFKREFVDKVGYFDERIYPIGPEDIELFYRTNNRGYRVAVTRESMVYHQGIGRDSGSAKAKYDYDFNMLGKKEDMKNDKLDLPIIKQL